MKFFGTMVVFLVLLVVAFMVGYKTETTADAGANPSDYGIGEARDSAPTGGVRFGADSSSAHR